MASKHLLPILCLLSGLTVSGCTIGPRFRTIDSHTQPLTLTAKNFSVDLPPDSTFEKDVSKTPILGHTKRTEFSIELIQNIPKSDKNTDKYYLGRQLDAFCEKTQSKITRIQYRISENIHSPSMVTVQCSNSRREYNIIISTLKCKEDQAIVFVGFLQPNNECAREGIAIASSLRCLP